MVKLAGAVVDHQHFACEVDTPLAKRILALAPADDKTQARKPAWEENVPPVGPVQLVNPEPVAGQHAAVCAAPLKAHVATVPAPSDGVEGEGERDGEGEGETVADGVGEPRKTPVILRPLTPAFPPETKPTPSAKQ